jgi:hypothetical protein
MSRLWMGADLEAAASGNLLLRALLSLTAILLACSPMSRVAMAAEGHDFQICSGYFALCAASTCQPIKHKTITVNVTGDGNAEFPQADCTCPIFSGHAIADVTGGNMKGSCAPPAGKIWSLYSVRKEIPQAPDWDPETAAPPQVCPKSLNLGNQLVNCFSFLCDSERYINGVPVATCHCPIGESLGGTSVDKHTAFVTQAGQGDQDVCAEHPVAGPISLP